MLRAFLRIGMIQLFITMVLLPAIQLFVVIWRLIYLQWDAIREGEDQSRLQNLSDFLGISGDGKGKLAGVTEFKLRFNPEKKHWPSEQVIIFKPTTLFFFNASAASENYFAR